MDFTAPLTEDEIQGAITNLKREILFGKDTLQNRVQLSWWIEFQLLRKIAHLCLEGPPTSLQEALVEYRQKFYPTPS